jgi:hypothetical protein
MQVLVAQQVYDLIETYAIDIEKNIDDLEGDLRITCAIDHGGVEYNVSPGYNSVDASRGRIPRVEDWSAVVGPSSLDALASPLPDLVLRRPASSLIPTTTAKREQKYEDLKTALASSSSAASETTTSGAAATHGARRAAAAAARVQHQGSASTTRPLVTAVTAVSAKQGNGDLDAEVRDAHRIQS